MEKEDNDMKKRQRTIDDKQNLKRLNNILVSIPISQPNAERISPFLICPAPYTL